MRMTVQFEGGRELSAALRTLGEESTKTGRKALRLTAKELQAELVAAAPRQAGGASTKSKRLRDGTVARYSYGQLFENIRVRERAAQRDNTIVMEVSTGRAFWGRFLEFGTSKMAARPWFRPVWDRMQNRLIGTLGQTLKVEIEKTTKRQARASRRVLANGRNA
jgi:HK97 gp10 family phage protein